MLGKRINTASQYYLSHSHHHSSIVEHHLQTEYSSVLFSTGRLVPINRTLATNFARYCSDSFLPPHLYRSPWMSTRAVIWAQMLQVSRCESDGPPSLRYHGAAPPHFRSNPVPPKQLFLVTYMTTIFQRFTRNGPLTCFLSLSLSPFFFLHRTWTTRPCSRRFLSDMTRKTEPPP